MHLCRTARRGQGRCGMPRGEMRPPGFGQGLQQRGGIEGFGQFHGPLEVPRGSGESALAQREPARGDRGMRVETLVSQRARHRRGLRGESAGIVQRSRLKRPLGEVPDRHQQRSSRSRAAANFRGIEGQASRAPIQAKIGVTGAKVAGGHRLA